MKAATFINKPSGRPIKGQKAKRRDLREFLFVVLVTLIHIPLGVTLYNTGTAGIIHPLSILGLGLYIALRKRVNNGYVICVAAYIIGSEVLWRMASVPAPWEFAKYSITVILLAAIFRSQRYEIPKLPLLYFMLLVPSCLITIADSDMSRAISTLSSNMSGPLLLLVSAWFFHNIRIRPIEFRRVLIAFILPLFSIAMAALFYTVSAEELHFDGESNFATSGGFGPNQVSSMLGLGVFVAAAGLLLLKKHSKYKLYFTFSALVLAALSVMTFSRGGMYNALGGIVVLLIFGLRDIAAGLRRIVPALIVGALFLVFIYPVLNDFTGGALQERFEDTGTTQRGDIAYSDLQIFLENPAFGIGIGASYEYRARFYHKALAHTEFTRMIAEHGTFGLAALAVMLAILIGNLKRPNSIHGRAFVAGGIFWACLYMTNAAMRLAAPGFFWGMGFLTVANFQPYLAQAVRRQRIAGTQKAEGGAIADIGAAKPIQPNLQT